MSTAQATPVPASGTSLLPSLGALIRVITVTCFKGILGVGGGEGEGGRRKDQAWWAGTDCVMLLSGPFVQHLAG